MSDNQLWQRLLKRHKPNNAKDHCEIMLKQLAKYRGSKLDDKTFIDLVYSAGLAAYSESVAEAHRNASVLDY